MVEPDVILNIKNDSQPLPQAGHRFNLTLISAETQSQSIAIKSVIQKTGSLHL